MRFQSLPIWRKRNAIIDVLKHNRVLILESPTGSGKTTQMPIILYQHGYAKHGMIGVTQPRRIAAVSVSGYMTQRLKDKGQLVAYKMRFNDTTDSSTRIKVMTDGTLLQELKHDPLLAAYSVIIVDESHERSLNIDFILGLLKQVLRQRDDLRVIISSATINTQVFSDYFDGCPIINIDAQAYPVEIIYKPLDDKPTIEMAIDTIATIVQRRIQDGIRSDILIFLTGEQAIKGCVRTLESIPNAASLLRVFPLYGRLSKEQQDRVFVPVPKRKIKVVVATNIAETSITIDGIGAIIDSGMSKMNHYDPRTHTASLIEAPISRSSADQRRGRAGRTAPGICYRLYSQESYKERPQFTREEIYRTDLSEVVLRMSEIGIRDFERFDFISSPGRRDILAAIETLRILKALNPDNSLSSIGKAMVDFPLLPRHSRMIVEAMRRYPQVLEETITATAFLTGNTPFLLPQGEEVEARRAHQHFNDDWGDFISYLKILAAYKRSDQKALFCKRHYLDELIMAEILNVKQQLVDIVELAGISVKSGGTVDDYLCAVGTGLIQYVCIQIGRSGYRSLTERHILIHPGSTMFSKTPQFIIAGEIVRTSRTYARSVSPLRREWVELLSPSLSHRLTKIASEYRSDERRRGQRRGERQGGERQGGNRHNTKSGSSRGGRDNTSNRKRRNRTS